MCVAAQVPLEKHVQESILHYLSLNGVFAWPNKTQGTYDPRREKFRKPTSKFWKKGVADILGITPSGRFFAIEVKRPKKGVLSQEQKDFIAQISARGGIAFVATSIADVAGRIEELRK